jgi:aryl-alcohol dehydrogenase-like predicted oxidoreductase
MSADDAGVSTVCGNGMQKRKLGTAGPEVSLVGLGTNNFGGRIDLEASRLVVKKALDLGITLIDTADSYGNKGGSEEVLGKILGSRRKDIVLATKFGMTMDDAGKLKGASRRYIMQAVEASLRRLNTDWIDFYQLHRPDPETPIEETLRALDDLVKSGKVRYIGCSNLSAAHLEEALAVALRHGLASFVSCQDEYSLLKRDLEKDRVAVMRKHGLGLLPYFPLASGLLTGKYKSSAPLPPGSRLAKNPRHADEFLNARNWHIVDALAEFAAQRGHTLLELAMSWLASRPFVASIIAGATKPEQVEQNIAAVGWALTPADLAAIDRITL